MRFAMPKLNYLFAGTLLCLLPAGATARTAAQDAPASAASTPGEARKDALAQRVARVGTREVTVGNVLEAAKSFFPNVMEEIQTGYGEWFLSSEHFDAWIDAYLDLLVLARHPGVQTIMPPGPVLEAALLERAHLQMDMSTSRIERTPGSRPAAKVEAALAQVRRIHGFEVARQARLDELVAERTEAYELRRVLYQKPHLIDGRVRARHLTVAIRDAGMRRFPRDRRERIREDAERLATRLRSGDSFHEASLAVTGAPASRPKDTLPWIAETSRLPIPVLRALFEASAGDIVGPVEIADGFYIGKVEETSKTAPQDFEKIHGTLRQLVRREDQYDLLQKLRSEVQIIIY